MAKKRPNYQKDTGWISPNSVNCLSDSPGAYGVLIRLPRQYEGIIGVLGEVRLAPGSYLYLGSAYDPAALRHGCGVICVPPSDRIGMLII